MKSHIFKSAVALAFFSCFHFDMLFLFLLYLFVVFLFFFILIILGLFPFVSVVLAKCICVGAEVPVLFMSLVMVGCTEALSLKVTPHFPIWRKGAGIIPVAFKKRKKRLHGPFQIKRLWSLTHPCNYFRSPICIPMTPVSLPTPLKPLCTSTPCFCPTRSGNVDGCRGTVYLVALGIWPLKNEAGGLVPPFL